MGPVSFLKDGDFPSLTGARGQGESRGFQRCHQADQEGESARTREMKALAGGKQPLEKDGVKMGVEKKKTGGKLS